MGNRQYVLHVHGPIFWNKAYFLYKHGMLYFTPAPIKDEISVVEQIVHFRLHVLCEKPSQHGSAHAIESPREDKSCSG